MTFKIDRITWRDYRLCVRIARREGKELAEVLNTAGLLLTTFRFKQVKADALRRAANALENSSAEEIMKEYGGTGNSALDMQRGVVAWLRAAADKLES